MRDVVHACRAAVSEHGWERVLDELEKASRGLSSERSDVLRGALASAASVARSGWAPIVAPLVAGLLTTVSPERNTTFIDRGPVYDGLEIPIVQARNGPLARARQRRMLTILGSVQAVGVAARVAGASKRNTAFAAGMMLPGAGFAYTKDPARLALTLVTFAFGLLLWFGAGGMIVPPTIWIGAALWAARRAPHRPGHWSNTAFVVAAASSASAFLIKRHRKTEFADQVEQAKAANEYLAVAERPLTAERRPEVHVSTELGDAELALTRRFVDMAFQDLDDWSNWGVIDQFQPAALRYQLSAVGDVLALQQFTHVPAFKGYLEEAQRRLISRYLQRKVWGYWALENLWGNLEWDPDPAKRQNIMMTGYFAQTLGLYQTVSGDLQHSEPGALTFVWNENRRYPLSYGALTAALAADYQRSPWGLVVCEPNWIYTLCNMRGGTGLKLHDRLHGTDYWGQIEDRYRRGFQQELVSPNGMVNGHRSTRAGFGGAGAAPSADLRNLVPNVADRGFLLLQAACRDDTGAVRTPFKEDHRMLDPGNYSFHPLFGYALVMDEAREAGDESLYEGAFNELQERQPVTVNQRGWLDIEGASVLAHAQLGRAMFGRHGGWIDIVEKGMPSHWSSGPVIDAVPYPAVMVARAESPDGVRLEAVLRTFDDQPRHTIDMKQLRPLCLYRVTGALVESLVADSEGNAQLDVGGAGRIELTLTPMDGARDE